MRFGLCSTLTFALWLGSVPSAFAEPLAFVFDVEEDPAGEVIRRAAQQAIIDALEQDGFAIMTTEQALAIPADQRQKIWDCRDDLPCLARLGHQHGIALIARAKVSDQEFIQHFRVVLTDTKTAFHVEVKTPTTIKNRFSAGTDRVGVTRLDLRGCLRSRTFGGTYFEELRRPVPAGDEPLLSFQYDSWRKGLDRALAERREASQRPCVLDAKDCETVILK